MNLPEKEMQAIAQRIEALQDLSTYRIFLETLMEKGDPRVFTNGGIDHATILMSLLFKNTKQTARIYCQGFRPGLTEREEYLDSLKAMLDTNVAIKALVKSNAYINGAAFQMLLAAKRQRADDSIDIRLVSEANIQEIHKRVQVAEHPCDFSVFDDKMARVEVDPEEYIAFGTFKNKIIAEGLIQTFDTYFEKSDVIHEE